MPGILIRGYQVTDPAVSNGRLIHGEWPYQSWGINRDPKAEWTLNFGRPVTIDELRLVIRTDFPHDNYWTGAKVTFSDGSAETLPLVKTARPQAFPIQPRTVEWLKLGELIQAEGPAEPV